jgi:hypothetical protein
MSLKRINKLSFVMVECKEVTKFKYLGKKLRGLKSNHEEIKSRLNSGNACYHSVQSLLSSRLLSRNVKVKYAKP